MITGEIRRFLRDDGMVKVSRSLKENGYKLAFTTKGGRVKKGSSKYELPRVRISGNTGIEEFKKKVE